MKKSASNNTASVTRSELQEELQNFRGDVREELDNKLRDYPTKKELHEVLNEELKDYPTKKELREVLNEELKDYPTKKELRQELTEGRTATKIAIGFAIEQSERRTDEKARQYRDELMTKLDQIVGELAQIREDQLFVIPDIKQLKEKDLEHEEQIKKLNNQVRN